MLSDISLLNSAREVASKAYSPYSNFKVGAALLCKNNDIFTGCNVENASYGASICAERNALCQAIANGNRDFVTIAIISDCVEPLTPCGICRQFMIEFNPRLRVVCSTIKMLKQGKLNILQLNDIMPEAFSKDFLT